jgi:hypothetical protein
MTRPSIIPTEAYPLSWPDGAARTPAHKRRRSTFAKRSRTAQGWMTRADLTVGEEIKRVRSEVERIARSANLVISTNLPTRNDGMPMASASESGKDPGVAVYWSVRKHPSGVVVPYVMPCDTYDRIADNLHAIALSIEAMRGLDRWGAVKLEQAFAGFAALPPGSGPGTPAPRPWREVLGGTWPDGLEPEELFALAKARHRKAIAAAHPDAGGDVAIAAELNAAIEEAERELGGGAA